MKPQVIYIASPYRIGDQATNVRVQIEAAHRILDLGHSPIAPLLNHFMDLYKSRAETDWLKADLVLVAKCDVVLRLPGNSFGADKEVELAISLDIPVGPTRRSPDVFSKGQPLAAYHGHDHLERDNRAEVGN